MATAIGLFVRIAMSIQLAIITLKPLRVESQIHQHNGACDEGLHLDVASKIKKTINKNQTNISTHNITPLSINQLSDPELLLHPLLTEEEATEIIDHRKQFGDFLDAAELVQCHFSVERIETLRPYIELSPPIAFQKKAWLRNLSESKHSGNIGFRASGAGEKTNPSILFNSTNAMHLPVGALLGYQMQWRYHNTQNFSVGLSSQLDPGETFNQWRNVIQKYHVRFGQFRQLDQCVLGRYSLQFGQGLVMGGLSGFWNAPLIWARKTPDWGLIEKRGWDEYQGHTGVGLAIHYKPLKMKAVVAMSKEYISARTDAQGNISSLITDGNFSSEANRKYQFNTEQQHASVGVFIGGKWGAAISGYHYNRQWLSKTHWPWPTLRTGQIFLYPELWFTQHHQRGGLQFGHIALQIQPNQTARPAVVWGYAQPLNKRTDISVRTYVIHQQFRPPQGLFNQFKNNRWNATATFSQGSAGKKMLRYGAEIEQNLRKDALGKNPIRLKFQGMAEKSMGDNFHVYALWQARQLSSIQDPWDAFVGLGDGGANAGGAVGAGIGTGAGAGTRANAGNSNGGGNAYNFTAPATPPLQINKSQFSQFQQRITIKITHPLALVGKASDAKVTHQITLIPHFQDAANTGPFMQYSLHQMPQPTALSNPQAITQIPHNSALYVINITHRKPFSPLKYTAEFLTFNTQQPLYHSPATTPTEIAMYVLSGRGYAFNALLQMSLKHPNHKHPLNHCHIAIRSEIIHKNTTENPVQPRIFVSLWIR